MLLGLAPRSFGSWRLVGLPWWCEREQFGAAPCDVETRVFEGDRVVVPSDLPSRISTLGQSLGEFGTRTHLERLGLAGRSTSFRNRSRL
jgi:hypothetical protein